MIFQRSADVPILSRYSDYRAYLRHDFQYRCAYCLTHEHYFLDGEGGQIDHHWPLHPPPGLDFSFSALKNAYSNLYWTCSTCNRSKGNCWPTAREYEAGERFLDPCREDHDGHWKTNPDGTVSATTPTGRYTIRRVRLDRPTLNRRRAQLYQDQQKLARIEEEIQQSDLSPAHRQVLREYLEDVRRRIFPPHFP